MERYKVEYSYFTLVYLTEGVRGSELSGRAATNPTNQRKRKEPKVLVMLTCPPAQDQRMDMHIQRLILVFYYYNIRTE